MGYLNTFNIGGTDYAISDGGLYGTCSTAAGTAAKVVTCANFDELVTGVTIRVKFTYTNTAANATMNVNSTGAKNLCRYGTTRVGTTTRASWQAGAIVSFTYDGTSWVQNDYLEDTGVTTDTKNTAGSTDSSSKLFLIGATSQAANPQTYSSSKVYETNGALVADSFNNVVLSEFESQLKISGANQTQHGLNINGTSTVSRDGSTGDVSLSGILSSGLTSPTYIVIPYGHGYTLADACAKGVDNSISSGSSSTNLPTSAAVASYVNSAIGDMSGALVYKGTASTASAISGTSYKKGWYWIAADTFALTSSINVEPGDMIIAKQDKTSTFANDIDVVQTNIDTLTTTEIDNLWAAA